MVALLAEGVDRNMVFCVAQKPCCMSPSSRRAWIEIIAELINALPLLVALLAEGVDRNQHRKLVDLHVLLSPF